MKRMIKIWDVDGEFIDVGFIDGVELVEGVYGWFSSLILLTCNGQEFRGYQCIISPFDQPVIEYKPLLLEYHNDER